MHEADVPDKAVRIRGPRSNPSQQIRLKAVEGGIFDSFFRDTYRPEVASDIICGTVVDQANVDVRVKLGDSRSTVQTVLEIYESLNL